MIIRFKDFRTNNGFKNYGKEIFKTESLETARNFMKEHEHEMRFMVGGGVTKDRIEYDEIYWDVVDK